ncbi:probable WRKY transcription factor 70 [Zea mays]|uniref:Putative WRKY transcription factor 30 n=1 Tax=Zea mays TaxID=4577 RepID=A0A1D6EIZ9_MAIZE|eukprot:XP_008669939.1 probable WRKY transcription factor 70 [Zea mays]
MACVADRQAAVREVAQVYELIKLQQPLLLLHSSSSHLAQSLLGKALRALNVALSVMNQQQPPPPPPAVAPVTVVVVKAEPHLSPPSPASADSEATAPPARRGAKRTRRSAAPVGGKKNSSSWATLTAVPYDDGYEWRKYGEKKINGTLFTRSYFRCTYKDDAGCLATKHVQQMDSDDNSSPPMFHVTYHNDHTCSSAKAAAKANTGSSSNNNSHLAALLADCCDGSGCNKGLTTTTINGHAAAAAAAMNMNMKQEPSLLPPPPPLAEPPSACFPYDQMPQQCHQLLFPVSMEQQFPGNGEEIPSAAGSCISGETSWDGYYYSGDMAAAEDDRFHDLERFLLGDSFMDYQY